MRNSGTAPRLFWATVIVVAAIGYVQHNVRAWRGGQDDFRQFYVAAQITSGQRPGPLYFPFRQRGVESCTDRVCPYVYPYSPLVALAVTPLAHWQQPTAAAVWFGINQLFTVLAFLALLLPWRYALTLPRLAVLLIVFANFAPVTRQHTVGNITSLQLLLAATALALLLDARDLVAGSALGLLVLIKPFWLLFAPFFAVARRPWAFAGMLLALPAGLLATYAALGPAAIGLWNDWITWVLPSYATLVWLGNNQALAALVARLAHLTPDIALAPLWLRAIQLAITVGITLASVLWLQHVELRRRNDPYTVAGAFGFTLSAALMTSSLLWLHYFMLLLLPITALLVQMFERPVSAGFVVCVAAATFVLARPGIRHPDLHLLTLGLLAIWMVSGWALRPRADVTLPRFWEKGRDSHTCAQVFAQHARQATSRNETGIAREIRTGRRAI